MLCQHVRIWDIHVYEVVLARSQTTFPWIVPRLHACRLGYLDASGNWGAGAVSLPHRFQFWWVASIQQEGITQKELLLVVLPCMVRGTMWSSSVTQVSCDNQAEVTILNSGYSKDPVVMHLLLIFTHFTMFLWAITFSLKDTQG